MSGLLEGKVAIVTGAASGLGQAMAVRFAEQGAQVVVSDIDDERGAKVAAGIGTQAAFVHADVTADVDIESLVAAAVARFGRLDVMVNNAGSTGDSSPILDLTGPGFDRTMGLDVRSVVLGHTYAARQFVAQRSGGSIITTASVAGIQGGWSSVSYTTAKHAIIGTVRHAALELQALGIRSNAIAPGVIMTPLVAHAFGVPADRGEELNRHIVDRLGAGQALGRYGAPEDIADAALFLASDLSSYVNGVVLPVDGGISAYTLSTSDADVAAVVSQFLDQQ